MDFGTLSEKKLMDLRSIAKSLGITSISKMNKQNLIETIEKHMESNSEEEEKEPEEITEELLEETSSEETSHENGQSDECQELTQTVHEEMVVSGILDLHADGYGFLRANRYYSGDDDIYVSPVQIRRFRLKTGDFIVGLSRKKRETEKFGPLIYVRTVNEVTPDKIRNRQNFEDLTPVYPNERIRLEWKQEDISTRIIDLISPLGKGQRGLIVSPPKAGKTSLLKSIANAIERNCPEIKVIVLLIDERPEEVTDMRRSVKGEVVASTFDELPQNHTRLSEIVLERAKRLVEHGEDVVVLLDSITRLSRAYNITSPPSGRTLSGGLDPIALNKPKRFFGAARNIEEGGSLTILATALVETGSRMDDIIYEEFKGTGNMEIHLDRDLSELRIFPAIDLYKSGTRKDELLLTDEEAETMIKLRRLNSSSNAYDTTDHILKLMVNSKNNETFIDVVQNQISELF